MKTQSLFPVLAAAVMAAIPALSGAAENPIIHADVPDVSMIRVGQDYYMSSTTMHMSPGVPIMKSRDLVNWEVVSYAYDTLEDSDRLNLANGQSDYGKGSWASSLRYHDGTYYVATFSGSAGMTFIYSTKDPDKGPWKKVSSFRPSLHDLSLFFDDDGRVYAIYGGGDLRLVELRKDLSGVKEGGVNKVIIQNANRLFGDNEVGGLRAEGAQLFKVDGKYHLFLIASPRSRWSRSVLLHRADKIEGPYEGRVGMEDKGVAQGGLIDTPEGDWYAYLFRDTGAVGRIPWLVPVKWEDGWPVLGVDGKAPETLQDLPERKGPIPGIVASDEFDRQDGDRDLPLVWQWNHNPDNEHWSLKARPGALRLTTSRVDKELVDARNTLTQRTFGPESSAETRVDASGMKEGDFAGLCALQKKYGFVGVKAGADGYQVVMVSAQSGKPVEVATEPLNGEVAYFKVDCDFRNRADKARFYFSEDGKKWKAIGDSLQMAYDMPHFMGYRFGLFNFATKEAGGFADFDYFRISNEITQ